MNSFSSSTLYINKYGVSLGISKNKFIVKKSRKIIFSMPKTHCERVIISARSVSISSDFIALCSECGIGIDFLDRSLKKPLATLSTPKHAYAKMTMYQLALQDTSMKLIFARSFLYGKTKNQINYLKYLNKYHKLFSNSIKEMQYIQKNMLQNANNSNELMGYEGQISNIYWSSLSQMVIDKVEFSGRITRGATDIVNASLNYGYAILYNRIHHHALKAGLSLHISFLHTTDNTKPTLVFDMIEEFRTFVVDRVIFRMFNQNEKLSIDENGRLDRYTQKRIVKKILDRLASYTKYQNESKEIDHIIAEQSYLLARSIVTTQVLLKRYK